MSQRLGPEDEDDDDIFIDSAGGIHDSAEDAIEANLGYEEAWGTGAGCGQDPDNL